MALKRSARDRRREQQPAGRRPSLCCGAEGAVQCCRAVRVLRQYRRWDGREGLSRHPRPRPVPVGIRYLPCVGRACTVPGQIPGKEKRRETCFGHDPGNRGVARKGGDPGRVRNRASSPEPGIVAAYAIVFSPGERTRLRPVFPARVCARAARFQRIQLRANSAVGSPACKGNLTASEGSWIA